VEALEGGAVSAGERIEKRLRETQASGR